MNTKTPRATGTGYIFSLGLANLSADLLPVAVSRTTKSTGVSFTMVCPDCGEAHKVAQQYVCTANPEHGPFGPNDAARALEGPGGVLQKLTTEQVEAIRAETTPEARPVSKSIDLGVYPALQVEANTTPAGTPYRLRPKKGTEQHYALFLHLVSNPDVAYLCEVAPAKVLHLYRLVARDGMITLVELARPEETYAPAPVTVTLDPRLAVQADALAELMLDEFDPEQFADRRRARMEELRSSVMPTVEVPTIRPKAAAEDLLALLERSIRAA